jgi:RNA-directed DNA polymerase
VHVAHGFEFLGYKIKRGKGLRMSAQKRISKANPLNLYAIPREKAVKRVWLRFLQIGHLHRRALPCRLGDRRVPVADALRG